MPRSGRSVSVKGKSLGLMVAPFDLPLNWVSVSPLSIYLGAGWLSPLQAAGRPFPATALRVGGRIVASPVVTPAPCLHRLVVPDLRGVSAGGTIGTLTTFAPSGITMVRVCCTQKHAWLVRLSTDIILMTLNSSLIVILVQLTLSCGWLLAYMMRFLSSITAN
uniref:Uncharacterized protein n=1 Tax=Opuntia streptacantha TaxID=393608 RepID=A0A7C9EI88_OPUST